MSDTSERPFGGWVLERIPGVEVLAGEDGRALAKVGGSLHEIPGLDAGDLLELLAGVDGRRTVEEVVAAAPAFEPEDAKDVLRGLLHRLLRPVDPPESAAPARRELHRVVRELAPPPRRRSRETAIRTVAVLGGGTAGYLAALTLRRKLPHLEVTVVESREVPAIGVGEATTPLLPALLHGTLGLDPSDFHRAVGPTWKLGIRFLWGKPAPHGFDYPFAAGRLEDALAHDGHLGSYSLPSLLMAAGRSPLLRMDDGELAWAPDPFAYHLDNRRFVGYLRARAEAAGIRRLDRRIAAAEREDRGDPDGPTVTALLSEDGERLPFDFFVDASGFTSLLLEKELESPFVSFAASLPTDSALVFETPRSEGPLPPYTLAETLERGWAWSLPFPDSHHRGYVFSSAHATADEAEAEARRRFPGMSDPRLLSFRCGRHRQAWKANVFALGNAYGFVEPLESTALHMVVVGLHLLVRHFPASPWEPAGRRRVNEHLGGFWDHLRDFLALHFRFNERLQTPFWRECRQKVELGGAEETLALYRERGNLSSRPHLLRFDSLWGDFGRDVLLRGQGVPAPPPQARLPRQEWRRIQARGRALADRALTLDEALAAVVRQPELLHRLAARAPWLQDAAVGGLADW